MRASAPLAALLAVAVLGAAAEARAQQVRVTMRADRTQVNVGQPFTVEIRVEATNANVSSVDAPSFDAFDVLAQRVTQPMSFSFGFGGTQHFVQSTTVYTYQLSARRAGRVRLTPARAIVAGHAYASGDLTIDVAGAGGVTPPTGFTPATPNPGVPPATDALDGATFDPQGFVRTVVDKPRPFVGDQVTVTIYLYVRGGIRSPPIAQREPSSDGFWVHDLLPPQRTLEATSQTVSGIPFQVYVLRRFAAFPLQPGTLTIGSMHVTVDVGSVFDIFGASPIRALERDGVPITIDAQPLPEASRPAGDVQVGRFTVTAALDRAQAATGDAVTLTAHVEGTGNLREVHLPTPRVDGLTFLEPQTRDEIEAPNDLVGGRRIVEWLVVPTRAGRFEIPALGFPTFDPQQAAYGRAQSAPLVLVAAGQTLSGVQTGAEPPPVDENAVPPADALHVPPLHGDSALRRRATAVSTQPFYPFALGAFPLLFLGLVASRLWRRRSAEAAVRGAPERAVRGARKRLSAAEQHATKGDAAAFYGEVARALLVVVEARTAEPAQGMTHAELRKHLAQRGMAPDLAQRVSDELDGADFARFSAAGQSREEMERTMDRVSALFERLDKFVPAPKEGAA